MASTRKPRPEDYAELRARQARLRHLERVAQQSRTHADSRRKKEGQALTKRRRDENGWRAISLYLHHQQRLMANERYITAVYGCETSWPRIERAALYYSYF